MNEIQINLTEEQKEIITKAFREMSEIAQKAVEQLSKIFKELAEKFRKMISSLEPRHRYKVLKKLGIINYFPYFKHNGRYHCRNNC